MKRQDRGYTDVTNTRPIIPLAYPPTRRIDLLAPLCGFDEAGRVPPSGGPDPAPLPEGGFRLIAPVPGG